LQVARDTLTSRESTQELRKVRFELGLTSELDYRQSIAEAAAARSTVHTLQYNVAVSEAALGVLTGKSPRDIVTGTVERGLAVDTVPVPPTVPAGLPSALLERRPDLVQAEQQLAAASANIGVAKAAYFPSISLTGLLGYESSDLTRLFTGPSGTWSYAGRVTMPILDFGRVKAGVEAAEARQRAALAGYEKAVQDAFREAQDALVANRKARGVVEAQTTQVTALRRSLHLARLRYDNGYSSYLEVLDAERSLFDVEISLASAQRDQLVAVVEVYRALGGGWGGIAPQAENAPQDAAPVDKPAAAVQ
jgi:multidrug efflux system outer membrane protein